MVAISYFFYKLLLVDFSVMFYVYSVMLKNLCQQKVLEFQQNAQLQILCDLWNIITTTTMTLSQ
jgi:hypothetical protein